MGQEIADGILTLGKCEVMHFGKSNQGYLFMQTVVRIWNELQRVQWQLKKNTFGQAHGWESFGGIWVKWDQPSYKTCASRTIWMEEPVSEQPQTELAFSIREYVRCLIWVDSVLRCQMKTFRYVFRMYNAHEKDRDRNKKRRVIPMWEGCRLLVVDSSRESLGEKTLWSFLEGATGECDNIKHWDREKKVAGVVQWKG